MILCGGGGNGRTVLEQAQKEGVDCVVIDQDNEVIRELRQKHPTIACLNRDATDVESLEAAAVERARGVVSVMSDDRANLVTTVTARQLSPSVRIVSRCVREQSDRQLQYAGADSVVNTAKLIGLRIASELIRPTVVEFLGIILGHDDTQDLVISGIRLENDELIMLGTQRTISQLSQAIAKSPASSANETPPKQQPAQPADTAPAAEGEPAEAGLELHGHFIICGTGTVGRTIAAELFATRRTCVCIDNDRQALDEFRRTVPDVQVIEGEPYSPDALARANVRGARSLATILASDRDNLVVVVTAMQANPSIRVLSVVTDEADHLRLQRAGAETICPSKIGGRRMASELLRPTATTVMGRMLASSGAVRFEAVVINEGTELAGVSLAKADLFTRTHLRILAARKPGQQQYIIKPAPETVLDPGTVLIVSGPATNITKLVTLVGDWA
jgi:Trk K+ transport system NAD-binding subunit